MKSQGYDPTILQILSIVGPEITQRKPKTEKELERRPLWRLNCAALYFKPNDELPHAADKSPGLRALLESTRSHKISTIDTLNEPNGSKVEITNFRDPVLIAAVVTLGGGADGTFDHDVTRQLSMFGEFSAPVRSRIGGLSSFESAPHTQHHVLLAPAGPWPDQPPGVGNDNGLQLWVPPMRLVAGRIPLLIELNADLDEDLIRTLGVDKAGSKLFVNRPASFDQTRLAADLTPDGIEFHLGLPDPVADLLADQPRTPPLAKQRVRLQPLSGEDSAKQTRLGLAMVDNAVDGRMDQAFACAFAQLRRNKSPLRVDYDPRPEVPPLCWPLLTQRREKDLPALKFPDPKDFGDPNDNKCEWRAEMGGDVFRMRLITGRAEGTFTEAVARANIADDTKLRLERDKNGTRLELASTEQFTVQVEATWTLENMGFVLDQASLLGTKEGELLEVHAALHAAADRLGARYAARGLLPVGQTMAPYLFLPIAEGVAQIKAPDESRIVDAVDSTQLSGGSLAGSVVLELLRKTDDPSIHLEPVRLEIDDAACHRIAVVWPRSDNPESPNTEVSISLGGLRGVVRNLLWLAEESPNADRALPTGRIAPAATGPMPLYLGAGVQSDSKLQLEWNRCLSHADSEAIGDSFVVCMNGTTGPLTLPVNGNDVDGNIPSITSINGVTLTQSTVQTITVNNGEVNVSAAGDITFSPASDYVGRISFPYVVSNGNTKDERSFTGTVTAPSLSWTAELHETNGRTPNTPDRPTQILWTRHEILPLISAAEMLRSSDASAEPSPTRDLFPSELKGPLILYGEPTSLLPSIYPPAGVPSPPKPQVRALWRRPSKATDTQWGAPEIALVAPSAPGLEFRQTFKTAEDGTPLFTDGFTFETSLRLDLPGLDELFAVTAPPRPAQPEAASDAATAPQTADPPATALDLDLLENQLWRRREHAQAMTRTVAARATKWFGILDDFVESGLYGLVEPWPAKSKVSFQMHWTGLGGALDKAPLGGWLAEWPSTANGIAPALEPFISDLAIAGLGGAQIASFDITQDGKELVHRDEGPIKIAGFAAALFPDKRDGHDVDGAGLTLQRRSRTSIWPVQPGQADSKAPPLSLRAAGVRSPNNGDLERRLVTFSAPVKVSLKPNGEELLFWIRDLPLVGGEGAWRFDAAQAGPERSLGADPTLLDREKAAAAIYEWRLHAATGDGWGFALSGLCVRPLRLLSVTHEGFKTLCAVELFEYSKSVNARFGDDRLYQTGNLIQLDFNWTEKGAQLLSAKRVRLQKHAKEVSEATIEVLSKEPLRFPVDYEHETAATGARTRERAELLLVPDPDGNLSHMDGTLKTALRLHLFGSLMQVEDGVLEYLDDQEGKRLKISFGTAENEAKTKTFYGVFLQTLSLVLKARQLAKLSMKFSASVPLPKQSEKDALAEAQEAMLIERHSDGKLTWLAAELSPADKTTLQVDSPAVKTTLQVDHARGVLRLSATNRDLEGTEVHQLEPIRGFVYRAPRFMILLDMVFPQRDDKESEKLRLPIAFASQLLDASGRLIASAGHVGATLRTELRIERRSEQDHIVVATMMLDLPRHGFRKEPTGAVDGWMESGISWPVAGLELGEPPTPGRARRFKTNADSAALQHEVFPAVTGWRVPLHKLGIVEGPGAITTIGVVKRIDILARVDHRLTPLKPDGEPKPKLTFTTLDRITLLDASKIADLAEEMLKVDEVGTTRSLPYGFAPRYASSVHRGLDTADEIKQKNRTPHAGIARPSIAGGGFRDLKLLEQLKNAKDKSGLLVFGAAQLALLPENDGAAKKSRVALSFAAPWVTASAWDAAPQALKELQDFTKPLSWVASYVDLLPFQFELAPNAGIHGPRLLSDPPQQAEDLLMALNVAVPPTKSDEPKPDLLEPWTETEVLEPALFDAEKPNVPPNAPVTPLPSKGIPLNEWPLFLRALVGLKQVVPVLEEQKRQQANGGAVGRWDIFTLLPPGDGDRKGGLAAVRFRTPFVPMAKTDEAKRLIQDFFAEEASAELVVFSSKGIRRSAPAPETGALLGAEAKRSAALRDAAEALSNRPRAILVERRDAQGFRLSSDVVPPGREAAELGARATKLRDREETVYASSALGWPETPFDGLALDDLTLEAGPDTPVLSAKAGLSGRVAGFGFRPKAAPKADPTVWFVSASRSRFLRRRDDSDTFSGAIAAPMPRHMTAPSVRARAPGTTAVTTALDKVAGVGTFLNSAPIMPAGLLRGAIGRRPGVMEIGYDALMLERDEPDPSEEQLLDSELPQSGVSATLGPAIMRILRRPRSTALPRDVVFARRRRTYVSRANLRDGLLRPEGAPRADGADLRESLVLEGAHVAMRQQEGELDRCLLVKLLTPTLADVLKERTAQVSMTLAVEVGDPVKIMPFLAETGFFAKVTEDGGDEYASLGAQLVAGDLRIPFSSVKWTKQGETLTLIFTLKQLDAEALAEGARVEAADLRVTLQLISGQKGAHYGDGTEVETKLARGIGSSKDKGKLPEVDDMLELPVLAAPLDRPTLPYAMRTAIFGDPAYDRSLASRPQSEERAVKSQDREHGFLFGIDRASHDLGSAIYLAAGEVDRADGAPPKWGPATGWTFLLSVQLQPYDPSVPIPPPARPLRLAKKGASETEQGDVWYNFDPQRRYAIPVAALYESGPMDKDGRTLGPPAALRPGDRLVLRVQVSRTTEQVVLRAETLLTVEPSVGTPEAVYSLLDVIGEKAPLHARVALHAPGPMPRRVEFPDFLGDLLSGHIRRRALFIWHEVDLAPLDGSTRHSTLVKFDLSGGGQLPMDPSDFEPPLEGVGA